MSSIFPPGPRRDAPKSGEKERTMSQSVETNLAKDQATVGKLMDGKGRSVFSIGPNDTLAAAVAVLKEKHIGALVVLGPDGGLAGILSERDIVRKLAETPGQTLPQTVSENMTENVITCSPDDSLVTVLRLMSEGKFRHMPVMEDGTVIGMLTIGDVVNYRLREVEHEALQLKQMIVG